MNRDLAFRLAALEAKYADAEVKASHGAGPSNVASIINAAGNAAGYGNTNPASIVAVLALPSLYTGLYRFTASARAATAAADVSTWALTTQTQAAAFAFTNANVLNSGGGGIGGTAGFLAVPGIAPPIAPVTGGALLASIAVASAAAGAGIGITGGPFGEVAQWSRAITMAGTGDAFSVSGFLYNNAGAATIIGDPAQSNFYRSSRSFALGNAVALVLKYTNSVADRAITAITMSLEEVRF